MASINNVVLVGNLAAEPEMKYTQSGKAVVNLRLAVNGRSKEDTLFITVVAWEKTAEACNEYLSKGSMVGVQGRLQSRSWENKQGQKQTSIELVANAVQFLTKKKGGDPGAPGSAAEDEVPF